MALINNKKIKIINFSNVYEYLYDDYLEYFYNVEDQFFKNNIIEISKFIINNEQVEFLNFILNNYLDDFNNIYLKNNFSDFECDSNPKKIIKIILEKNPTIQNLLNSNDIFIMFLKTSTLESVKGIYNLRDKEENINFKLRLINYFTEDFKDKRVFFWLLEKNIFTINEYDSELVTWIQYEILGDYKYNYDNNYNINNLLKKMYFDKSKLKKIFKIPRGFYCNCLLAKLISSSKNELIYNLFELVEPSIIIKKKYVKIIFYYLIGHNDYKMFVFILKHIINLKYDSIIMKIIKSSNILTLLHYRDIKYQTDKIAYELIKLGAKVDKNSKYYYNNIQIIPNKP